MINSLLETIIFPIFDVDMNHNGIPDYQEISKILNFTIFGISFNFGFFFLNIIKYLLFIVIVYLLIQVISKKTNLINLEVN